MAAKRTVKVPVAHKFTWDRSKRGEAVRPYRLWDAENKKNLAYRCYSDPKRAHMAALIEARWQAVGTSIEVYDVRGSKFLGSYTRRISTILFMEA